MAFGAPIPRRPRLGTARRRPTTPLTLYFHVPSRWTGSRSIDLFAGVGEGKRAWGFLHIKSGKWQSFEAKGLGTDQQIIAVIRDAVTDDYSFVYHGVRALEFYRRHGDWLLKVIVNSDTGRVVTAMPISGEDGDYTLQAAALAAEIANFPERLRDDIAAICRRATLQHILLDFLKISKSGSADGLTQSRQSSSSSGSSSSSSILELKKSE